MITIRDVHKSFGRQTLLEGAFLQINEGDRFALVGPNGSGKSTLFKMLLGEAEPDDGEIQLKKGVRAGYLPQENAPVTAATVLEEALSGCEDPDGRTEANAKAILMGLGFKTGDFSRRIETLSGGWAMRAAMARLLVTEPDLLLLDEPTNHLDMDSLFWLQDYLQYYQGAVFVISHDRAFINSVCRAIVSVQDRALKVYHGDYENYLAQRETEKEKLISAWKQQQDEIAKMQDFIDRNRVRASTASRAQSMIKRLEKMERIELPQENKTVKIRFPQPERTGVRVLSLKNVNKSYGEIKVYENLDFELERGWKMAFVGHNGAGKSTLLKLLAGVIPSDSGERLLGLNVKTGYFSQHRAGMLDPHKTVLREAMDNDRMNPELMVRTVLGTFLFPGDSVFKKTAVLSGGEKSRLALVKLLLDPPNVLLMDEPTTHLDMASVDALIGALKEYEGTLCCISHDVYFLNSIADHVVHVDGGKITVYPGNYEYFQRRQEQLKEETEGSTPEKNFSLPPHPKETSTDSREAERRQKALEREKARKAEKLKTEIQQDRAKIESLAGKLTDPEIYKNYAMVQETGEEIKELEMRIAEKEKELGAA